jgi:outer membrane protein assembly factor BamE (lipoprotein component of BamABCDE complex)
MMYGTAADMAKLSTGMSKTEVISAIGPPSTVSADSQKHEEKLTYRRMTSVTGWYPGNYDVILVDGKVVKFGERAD